MKHAQVSSFQSFIFLQLRLHIPAFVTAFVSEKASDSKSARQEVKKSFVCIALIILNWIFVAASGNQKTNSCRYQTKPSTNHWLKFYFTVFADFHADKYGIRHNITRGNDFNLQSLQCLFKIVNVVSVIIAPPPAPGG